MTDYEQHGMSAEEIEAIQDRYGKGPHLAADLVVLTARWDLTAEDARPPGTGGLPAGTGGPDLRVLLIERANKPYRGRWALPGGFVDMGEDLEPAARRELQEETGIADLGSARVEQVGAFGHPLRDPRSRVISVVHLAWVPWRSLDAPQAGDDAAAAQFVRIRNGSAQDEHGKPLRLAFDHDHVLARTWERVRIQAEHSSAPLALAPPTFTSAQACALYEAFTGPSDRLALVSWLERNRWIEQAGQDMWRVASTKTCWERPTWQSGSHPD
jgi:ADP-ribose pyrophosphatase YjhB (NUDIX family)